MKRQFEHNQIVVVSDPTSPHYQRRGEIWVITRDTVKARNPDDKVRYCIAFTDSDDESALFYEDQLSA